MRSLLDNYEIELALEIDTIVAKEIANAIMDLVYRLGSKKHCHLVALRLFEIWQINPEKIDYAMI